MAGKKNNTSKSNSIAPVKSENTSVLLGGGTSVPGLEGVESDMLTIPRLKLVQSMSDEIMEHDMKAGWLCNSVTKDPIGNNSKKAKDGSDVEIIPLFVAPRSRILFKNIKEGGGILCRSTDGKVGNGIPGGMCRICPKKNFGENSEAPECTDFINVFCTIPGYDSPIPLVVSFAKTNMGVGRQLVNFLVQKQKSPWLFKFRLSTEFVSGDKGDYFEFRLKPNGETNTTQQKTSESLYRMLRDIQYKIDDADLDAEAHVATEEKSPF